MEYKFKKNIDIKEYNEFTKNYSAVSFMQESYWSSVKNNWDSILCGIYSENKLVAVCQILVRSVLGKTKMFYIPRGYLVDFTNQKLLSSMTQNIKNLAKEQHAYVVKIDPNICKSEYSYKDPNANIYKNYSLYNDECHNNLIKLGYKHTGLPKDMHKNFQPRYNMVVPLIDENNELLNLDGVLRTFKSKFKYYLGDYHKKRGVSFEITDDIKRIPEFVNILKFTEETKGISLRNTEYFERIFKNFKNRAYLIFGKVDLTYYLNFLRETNAKEKEITEVEELIKSCGEEIVLSTALILLPDNKGIRTSEYIYAGNNLALTKLSVSAGVCFEAVKLSIQNKCHYCNLGGVDGNLKDSLSIFKSKFNATVFEFIGEYDLIINKPIYYLSNISLPVYRGVRKIIKK